MDRAAELEGPCVSSAVPDDDIKRRADVHWDVVVVVVEFYLKSQHKQAMAPSFIHVSDMKNFNNNTINSNGEGGEKITTDRSHRR